MTASDICGAWGGCPLPKGHNMGRLDIPENHAAPPAPDPAWVEAGAKALGIDFVDPLAVEAVIAAVEPLIRERIAQEIEAHAEKVGAVDPPPQQDDYYAAMHDAARIARGGSDAEA